MNDKPNFASILDEAPNEVTLPPTMPEGTYEFIVKGWGDGRTSEKGNKSIDFTLQYLNAEDDVDVDELAEVGGCAGKQARLTFWITEDAVYRLDEFHEHCGLDLGEEMSRRMRNDAVMNCHVRGFVRQKPSKDGTRMFANIDRTLKAD